MNKIDEKRADFSSGPTSAPSIAWTKEPWIIDPEGFASRLNIGGGIRIFNAGRTACVAVAVSGLNEAEDNARLIAAAPDLYAALKALVEATTEVHGRFDGYQQEINQANDAIFKAEGRS